MWSARLTRDCIDLRCLLALRDCIDIALPARLGTRLHWPPHHCAVCSPCAIALTLRCLLAMVRDCIGLPTKSAMIALTCALSARLLRDCTDIALSRTVCPPLWWYRHCGYVCVSPFTASSVGVKPMTVTTSRVLLHGWHHMRCACHAHACDCTHICVCTRPFPRLLYVNHTHVWSRVMCVFIIMPHLTACLYEPPPHMWVKCACLLCAACWHCVPTESRDYRQDATPPMMRLHARPRRMRARVPPRSAACGFRMGRAASEAALRPRLCGDALRCIGPGMVVWVIYVIQYNLYILYLYDRLDQ